MNGKLGKSEKCIKKLTPSNLGNRNQQKLLKIFQRP
jgi:hypothetical protein